MGQQLTILDVTRMGGNRYRLALSRPGEPFTGPTFRVLDVDVRPQDVSVFREMIVKAVADANLDPAHPGHAINALRAAGRGLCGAFLPDQVPGVRELRQELASLDTALLILTDEPEVCWEQLYDGDADGDNFLGLKYDVGRSLKIRRVPQGSPRKEGENWRCLIIANPNAGDREWELPETGIEAAKLRKSLETRGVECHFLEGAEASLEGVLRALLSHQYDIIHYAGHILQDASSAEYAFRLNDHLLTAGAIRSYVKGSPTVFLNGCWSAKTLGLTDSMESVKSLTDAFLHAGAQVVVGSLFETPDAGARAFAEKFYELVLGGKTIGEAMRQARKHVMGSPDYAAAWACFVLYGNPCLRLQVAVDEVQRLLDQAELSKMDFEPSALRVVEQAYEFGRPTRGVDTAHLFAAMVGGANPFLRERLKAEGASGEDLREAFQGVFRFAGEAFRQSGTGRDTPVRLSENAENILKKAHSLAVGSRPGLIDELHLAEAFAVTGGGGTGEILRQVNVDPAKLNPRTAPPSARPPASGTAPMRVGPLAESDCTPDCWAVLVAAASEASTSGAILGTPQLFLAMLGRAGGALPAALGRLGVRLALEGAPVSAWRKLSSEVRCSENAGRILLLAQANAAGSAGKVSEADLLAAFVQDGGGATGEELRRRGLVLQALTSALFHDGLLDSSCFDDVGQKVIEESLECARRKGHSYLGRKHLLYGMLSAPGNLLVRRIRDQGLDAEQLADLLYAGMAGGSSSGGKLMPKFSVMSPDLVKTLCAAELDTREQQFEVIGDAQLLGAWLADGGGAAGEFLIRNGVKLRRLI
jgi:hypothetical protein